MEPGLPDRYSSRPVWIPHLPCACWGAGARVTERRGLSIPRAAGGGSARTALRFQPRLEPHDDVADVGQRTGDRQRQVGESASVPSRSGKEGR
jgi:hypothetical protein